jgi:protein subunit release factor B
MAVSPNTEPAPQRVAAIREQLGHLEEYVEPAALAARIAELEGRMGAPGFWDDQEGAAQVSAEHARATRKLETFRSLERDVGDLDDMLELAQEDDSLAGEVDQQLASIEDRLGALEEERLFSGRYDTGDALVTVNAGAGGTDAQDWAEMVLRMLMRWAERRGFRVELLEASPGEEAGIKSATFRASGENAYGLFSAEKGVHRPTGIVVQCQNERSQGANKQTAMNMLRSRLVELEERKRQEEIARERGEAQDVNFGSQIRSYVLHPYTMVKDHRTTHEMGDAQRVLDGDLDGFVRAELLRSAGR